MIYFIRHGQSQANADNVFGSPETPLTEIGRQQAKAAGEKLKADGIVVGLYHQPMAVQLIRPRLLPMRLGLASIKSNMITGWSNLMWAIW